MGQPQPAGNRQAGASPAPQRNGTGKPPAPPAHVLTPAHTRAKTSRLELRPNPQRGGRAHHFGRGASRLWPLGHRDAVARVHREGRPVRMASTKPAHSAAQVGIERSGKKGIGEARATPALVDVPTEFSSTFCPCNRPEEPGSSTCWSWPNSAWSALLIPAIRPSVQDWAKAAVSTSPASPIRVPMIGDPTAVTDAGEAP